MAIEQCVVGIRTPTGSLVKAFDVCIKGEDVYVNYSDSHTPAAHGSYHASGQQHTKIGREYVKWDIGPGGEFVPMKFIRTPTRHVLDRSRCWVVGWNVPDLDNALLPKLVSADVVMPAQRLQANETLGIEVSIIGHRAQSRLEILGFPVIARHQFGSVARVEIEAFVVSE
jgi:hypothetical protein